MRHEIHMRNSLGRFVPVLDENGRPADFTNDPVSRGIRYTEERISRMDMALTNWWTSK
jgi:hypothetical protein